MLKPVLMVALVAFAVPAVAGGASNPAPKALPKGDPNRIICEREEVIGSRLGGRRVCLTALQWEEKRREHRESTERVQRSVNQSPSN